MNEEPMNRDTERAKAVGRVVHLRAGGVSLVLDCRGPQLPLVVHWGSDLGPLTNEDLDALASTCESTHVAGTPDRPQRFSIIPEHAAGWAGLPGLRGSRAGADWSPCFRIEDVIVAGMSVEARARDTAAAVDLDLLVELTAEGLVRMRATVTNAHPDAAYTVDGLVLTLPIPTAADELLDLTGRWARERVPQRSPFLQGTRLRDSRRGRTGADATLLMVAGIAGFGWRGGEAWGVHVGWSGNHRTYAERLPTGERLLGAGELLFSSELRLAPGESYSTPWVFGSYGDGLDELSGRFHKWLRNRPEHPHSPRPVVVNTWEAVYFDHDVARLTHLADDAAAVGAERFVLDDGWFRYRRDDHAGLGDWYVDEHVWPQGLHPLVDHVRSLGMEFGLWFEPEMVNPDSDLARAHPDWILATGGRLPAEVRSQQVLDVAHPEAWRYLFERIDALVKEYGIAYLKWDHNRDLVDAGRQSTGRPGVHEQTDAVYRLMAALKEANPGLEIESCSSGGARVDLGILQHTDRVWSSDCIDPHERQAIQRWTALLLPPELTGSHIGSGRAHTTGRRHELSFRAATALFGHLGIEWDLTEATAEERTELAAWVALYKRLRPLLHTGTVVRTDHADPATWVHGVVANDLAHAVYAVVAMATSDEFPLGRVTLPGLAPERRYEVRPLPPGDRPHRSHGSPRWLSDGRITLPGRALEQVGVPMPALLPDQALLLEVTEVS
jgi:alpha-galactosidase